MSPHVVRIEERVQVDHQVIGAEQLADCCSRVAAAAGRLPGALRPTYFETLTAAAFLYFAEQQIDFAVLEVGMGGRLDSTNVVTPELSIVTPVGLDHQAYLGETVEKIALEKAGVIRPGKPLLLAPQRPEADRVLVSQARRLGAPVMRLEESQVELQTTFDGVYPFEFQGRCFRPRLPGRSQALNAALAIQASEALRSAGLPVTSAAQERGVADAWLIGRLQKLSESPCVLVDGAHNRDAVRNLREYLERHTSPPRALVFGMMKDKEIREALEILTPAFRRVFLSPIRSNRAASVEELREILPTGTPVAGPWEGLELGRRDHATVVAAGSFYLVGEILAQYETSTASSSRP
jgi:dihydrofolate synthase/folylpolyglutamate synthase